MLSAKIAKEIKEHILNENYLALNENLVRKNIKNNFKLIQFKSNKKSKLFLDLFSGVGGFSIGLKGLATNKFYQQTMINQ